MEIIASIGLIVFVWAWFKAEDNRANKHCRNHDVDWVKVNEDRIMNDLSNYQVNQNIANGKYDRR